MNQESNFQVTMIEHFKEMYGIENETALYHYFVLRFFIKQYGKRKVDMYNRIRELVWFMCDELGLPSSEQFLFEGEWMTKGFGLENSLRNVMESWTMENDMHLVVDEHGVSFDMEQYLKVKQQEIVRYANSKSKRFKQTKEYEWHWKYYALRYINNVYKATPKEPRRWGNVHYEVEDHVRRTMEEIGEAWVHASKAERSDSVTISESDLEQYLCEHPGVIEEGLEIVGRQIVVEDGRIDLLAIDRNGIYVILELKVQNKDKELVWQCMHYPLQIKKMYKTDKVRMITIAPSYSNSLAIPLHRLGYVEMMTYSPKVVLGRIDTIEVNAMSLDHVA